MGEQELHGSLTVGRAPPRRRATTRERDAGPRSGIAQIGNRGRSPAIGDRPCRGGDFEGREAEAGGAGVDFSSLGVPQIGDEGRSARSAAVAFISMRHDDGQEEAGDESTEAGSVRRDNVGKRNDGVDKAAQHRGCATTRRRARSLEFIVGGANRTDAAIGYDFSRGDEDFFHGTD
ncbi:unnamed protein product [Linum trigynum]|uniref:Uncharacterized protein n=1 Tax=Linum trigynum TaxID=586398 RepID=A0AAV2CY15_9ROSI